jgi:hypothetical protein
MRILIAIMFLTLGTTSFVNCQNSKRANINVDSVELTTLTRNVYKWYETTTKFQTDFNYIVRDSLLKGIDWTKNKERMEDLQKTDLFDTFFLNNLKEIAEQIDKYCKEDNEKYQFNLYPPWVSGANDWCNCQISPDNYWETLTISNLKDNGDSADFNWTWGNDFYYHVKAKKTNNKWRISYLQGWDKKEHIKKY